MLEPRAVHLSEIIRVLRQVPQCLLNGQWIAHRDVTDTQPIEQLLTYEEILLLHFLEVKHQHILHLRDFETQYSSFHSLQDVIEFVVIKALARDHRLIDCCGDHSQVQTLIIGAKHELLLAHATDVRLKSVEVVEILIEKIHKVVKRPIRPEHHLASLNLSMVA